MLQDARWMSRERRARSRTPLASTLSAIAILVVAALVIMALTTEKIGIPGDLENAASLYAP